MLVLTGCKSNVVKHPEETYAAIEKLVVHGELNSALKKAETASAQFSQMSADWNWKFRLLQARILLQQEENEQALSLLIKPLPDTLKNTDIALERVVLQALVYTLLGRRSDADEVLKQVEILAAKNHLPHLDNPSQLESLAYSSWGSIYLQRSDPLDLVRANDIFQKSLAIAQRRNDLYQQAAAEVALSAIALHQERFDEALDWSELAARNAKRINARTLLEISQGNVAWANYKLGNFEEAYNGFVTAEAAAKSNGQASDRMEWLNNIGLSLYRLGHSKEAETYYQNTLKIAEDSHDVENIIDAHVALSELLLGLKDIDQAGFHADKALDVAHTAQRKSDEMNIMFLKSLISASENHFDDALEILKSMQADDSLTPSLRWQVEGELANQYTNIKKSAPADNWYRQSIATFESQRKTLKKEASKLPFSTNADQLYSNYIRFLVHENRINDALQWLDQGRARTLEEGLGIASPDFNTSLRHSVQTASAAAHLHGTILVYSLASDESYLWAINSAGTRFFKLPSEAVINEHVKNYQHAILESKDPISDAYVDGMELYKILVEPAQSMIPKGSQVYVIPDGSLSTLNFETLLAPGGGLHYWIEDATITDASSLKLLAHFDPNAHRKAAKKLLLIGDPISPDEKYPNLPNAAGEIEEVSKHFSAGEQSVFTQQQALPSAYENSTPGQYSYIHFVAHGTSSSASPLDSAIVLTRAPQSPDSFKLYARDVIQHPLQADLVAVSACYGSGSRTYGGEGLIGLSWAFLRAGAHYVIGSLWQVSDAAAPQLMDRMYDDLARGQNPAMALREAKLSLVHSKGIFRKPLYWATFQIYGGS